MCTSKEVISSRVSLSSCPASRKKNIEFLLKKFQIG